MSRRPLFAVGVALAVAGSLVAPIASANTTTTGDRHDRIGLHDIRSLVVDNTGERIGATVGHRGRRWAGSVRLAFDVSGGPEAEYVAVLRHARKPKDRFWLGNGRVWRCATRAASSRPDRRNTVLSAPRRCFDGATFMSVRVTASSPKRRSDQAGSGRVLQQTRPNVVMILVDDMRADDIRYMPKTRRLIGGRGVTFANSLAPHPLCCPARASILRGQYTHNHGVYSHKAPYAFPSLKDHSTIATWLKRSGYATVFLGKYLNGYGRLPEPGAETGRSVRYVPPGWTDWRASIDGGLPAGHPKNGGTYRYFDTTLSRDGRGFVNYAGRYQTHVFGALSSEIIRSRAASDRPFFLFASYAAPHHGQPRESDDPKVYADDGKTVVKRMKSVARPAGVRGMFDRTIKRAPGAGWSDPDAGADKPHYLQNDPLSDSEKKALLEVTRQRAEALSVVDGQVKRTIDALAATGELEETLVMFTSDNGYFLGEQGIRQGKILPHDPALRTPMLMRGPGIPAGRVRYDPFLTIDFAPTIADVAGVRPASFVDGKSMLPVARRGDGGWTRPVLTQTGPRGIVQETDESGETLPTENERRDRNYVIGIRTDRYLYTDVATGEEELYDIKLDPKQYDNLDKDPDYLDVKALLAAELARMRSCRGAECRQRLPAELANAPGESIRRPAYRRR